MQSHKILIIDDEIELAEIIRDYLVRNGYSCMIRSSGKEALTAFDEYSPDLLVLDVMLPDMDGMEVCRLLRSKSDVPILMLSAKCSDIDKILGLGLGADDYITKPFSSGELLARVNAHLRRYKAGKAQTGRNQTESGGLQCSVSDAGSPGSIEVKDKAGALHTGDLRIDSESYSVFKNGEELKLTAKEFELLYYLASNHNRVFTREQIFNRIWNFDEFGDINTVTVHIRRIREKIEDDPSHPVYIKTIWGVGYKFDEVRK
ncbi:MAG: winged helix-turn-helix domain-containing protein [Bacillota bacterium]